MWHNLQSQREIFLYNNSRARCCAWLRSYSVTLWPWWYGSACSDAVFCPASGFSCLPCLWSFSGPTAKTCHWSISWRLNQALCLPLCACAYACVGGGVGVYVCLLERVSHAKEKRIRNWLQWWQQDAELPDKHLLCSHSQTDMWGHATFRPN